MALYVVIGPPGAGKTTWISEHASHGDVVVDYDRLADALTVPGGDGHTHTRTVRTVAHRARMAAIAAALRYCATVDVYIIHTQPRAEAMAKYARHGAMIITIDPGQDVVMQRVDEQRTPEARVAAEQWYAAHSDTPSDTQSDAPRVSASASRSW